MAQFHDYIPPNDEEVLKFAKFLYAYALVNYARWGVPSPQALLEAPITAFETALTAYQNPNHGKVDTLAKNEGKKAMIHALRTYIQGYIAHNPAVSDEDKERMSLPLRDSTPTPHPAPDIKPEVEVLPAGKGKQSVTALNPQSKNKQKPPFTTGVAFAHKLRNAEDPRAQPTVDMPSEYQTAATKDFQWGEELYGKVCDYACAYEGEGGKRGPWSDVVSLIIS